MEDQQENLNFITCAVWVPRGVAKGNPDKVEISKDDLQRIISETQGEVKDLDELEKEVLKGIKEEEQEIEEEEEGGVEGGDEEAPMEVEDGGDGEEEGGGGGKGEGEGGGETARDPKTVSRKNDDELDFETRYIMKNYDEQEDESMNRLLHLGQMSIHASSEDDPYITVKDKDDIDSEDGDYVIKPTDNLIAVGHVEGDAAILEVYVYNAEEGHLYVHHDILLPAVPLCMEWLNYDPGDQQLRPGNMVAMGSMSPVIELWDLDLVDCLEPACKLGKKGKKKKKIPGVGHKDAVLSLSWNRHAEHVLASGSVDETVILWDMQYGTVAQQLTSFKEKVQSIEWHHKEPHSLLTGACDKYVRLFDCNSGDSFKSWKVDGEVERVTWDKHSSNPYNCLASTDKGTVYGIDCRQEKPMWTLDAHTDGCTGLQFSPQCPGCLVTVSVDNSVKVWDVANEKPTLIKSLVPRLGVIHCLSTCPDLPFVFCMGGDNKENNFKVLDIRQSKRVRTTFCNRVGLPADEDGDDDSDDESKKKSGKLFDFGESSMSSGNFNSDRPPVVLLGDTNEGMSTSTKPKKFKKKKGGHLENKRRR